MTYAAEALGDAESSVGPFYPHHLMQTFCVI